MGATERVAEVRQWAEKQLAKAKSLKELQDLRVEVLGRSRGRINQLIKSLRDLAPDERPAFGEAVNRLRTWASQQFATRLAALTEQPATAQQTDVTQPGRRPEIGRIHPITRVRNEMVEIFGRMGFEVAEGPEVEDEWHNFAALNVPAEHPARDPLDNYYISDNVLLRTQTSTVQIRVMENRRPPIRIIAPGRVYRPDTLDAGHSNMFHQLEGLWVDEGVSFADLKSVLTMFAQSFFGPEVRTRFVPSYFPFTEPSAEFYVSCLLCNGEGCPVCKRSGWVEIGGSGMVDPNVFEAVGYDSEKYTGLAFGFGIERPAMMKYGIHDIRLFYQNDLRFLRQF